VDSDRPPGAEGGDWGGRKGGGFLSFREGVRSRSERKKRGGNRGANQSSVKFEEVQGSWGDSRIAFKKGDSWRFPGQGGVDARLLEKGTSLISAHPSAKISP